MTFIINMWLKFITNVLKISVMKIIHSFDLFDLLMSVPFETSILSYCSLFITHTNITLKEIVDNIYHLL